MEFWLLGPLVVRRGGSPVAMRKGRQRAVLATLLLQAGQVVAVDDLVEAVWESPPPSARVTVQNYVSRLRQQLEVAGRVLIGSQPGGYVISLADGELDVTRFESLSAGARAAARNGSWEAAAGQAAAALELWRGQPLADSGSEVLAQREGPRLEELRMQAVETRIDAQLRLGRQAEVVGELRRLTRLHPLRENLQALLMLALYRDSQQAEALAVYQDVRGILAEELGSDPGARLQELHQQILTASPALAAPRPGAVSPAPDPREGPREGSAALEARYALPPDVAAFTGRDAELDAVTDAAHSAAEAGSLVTIQTIGGMPGAGKTALAVHAAHRLADRFPDRQLFVSLHGHTPGQHPVAPQDALAGLLSATGLDPRDLPGDLEGRATLWRHRMAGERAILVLDNAASSAQVTPLLPGRAGCLVLVTSRRHLGDLPGAVPVLLEALPPARAAEMFLELAPRAADGPRELVAELADLAGFLPLAISLLARVYARHPSWTLADLAAETRAGLLTMAAERDSVAAAFEISYRHLPAARQRFFRVLGLHPGTTADAYAAAALAGIPLAQAAAHLDALHGEGLLTETGYRRYGMHDLIRRYARDLAAGDSAADAGRAVDRLLDYYQHAVALAEARLVRQPRLAPPPAAPAGLPAPDLGDAAGALAWARAERAGLLACLDHAVAAGQHARVVALTAGLAPLLRRDGPWAEAVTRHAAAARAAERLGDRHGQASALSDLAYARRLEGDYPAAARAIEEALGIRRDIGDRPGQAGALSELGAIRRMTSDYPAAAQAFEQALTIHRDIGNRHGQASAFYYLGGLWRLTGDYRAAVGVLEQSLGIYRELGSRGGQVDALSELGFVRRSQGDYPAAARLLEQALSIARDIGGRRGQANALSELGALRRLTGDYPAAAQALEEALDIYRDLGDRLGEANAVGYLGDVRRLTGDYPAAARALEQALDIFRDLGDRDGEAETLNDRAALHRDVGELARAQACHRQALTMARGIAAPGLEADALAGLGRCALAAGDAAGAQALLRQALEVSRRIGAAGAPGLAAELDALAGRAPGGTAGPVAADPESGATEGSLA